MTTVGGCINTTGGGREPPEPFLDEGVHDVPDVLMSEESISKQHNID